MQVLDIPYLLSTHNVLNVPPQEKIKWREIWASRWPDSLMPGLEGVDQYPGHLEAQISLSFLWGYIKNTVYAEKIRNIQYLQERITSAIETVRRDMIHKTWKEIEFRLDVSRAINDANIEI